MGNRYDAVVMAHIELKMFIIGAHIATYRGERWD
ncbi:MAG: hypothetical protein ACJA00_005459 [Myxococcota bacterium]